MMIIDMGVKDDGMGWEGIVSSGTYDLGRKRAERDSRLAF
jgi:hypothetical protein